MSKSGSYYRPTFRGIESDCVLHFAVPGAPRILARESSVMNNTITFVWEAHRGGGDVGGYVLELDDGSAGQFRVSHIVTNFLLHCL